MKIENQKQLETLVRMCRKQGVSSIEVDGVKVQMGDVPEADNAKKLNSEQTSIDTSGDYSDEELAVWSAGGLNG